MGTWGSDTFDDDDALDWIADLERRGIAVVEESVEVVASSTEYVQTDVGSRALSACEAVAALIGRPSAGLPDELCDWVAQNSSLIFDRAALAVAGSRALDVVVSDRSELRDRWAESDGYDEWRQRVLDLQARICEPFTSH